MASYKYWNNKGQYSDIEKSRHRLISAAETSSYASSIRVFKYNFEKHYKKVANYRHRLSEFGGGRLIFLIDMLSWDFIGLTAVGNTVFDCGPENIPLCKDIVDIISTANKIDAVVLLYNLYPFHDSIVFSFTPAQAKSGNIGVEIFEYAGQDEYVKNEIDKAINSGVNRKNFYASENFKKIKPLVFDECKKAVSLVQSGKPCLINTGFYNTLVNFGVIPDQRQ